MKISPSTFPLFIAAGLALTAVTAFPQYSGSTRQSSLAGAGASAASDVTADTDTSARTAGRSGSRQFTMDQFMAVDTDHDGRISLREFVSSSILSGNADATTSGTPRSDGTPRTNQAVRGRNTPELFRLLDKNGDGYLSAPEIAAYYQTDASL